MFTMRRKCDIILIVVIKEVRGYEKPEPTAWRLFHTQAGAVSLRAKVIQV